MLFCETAGGGRGDAEDLAIFASQLAALGVPGPGGGGLGSAGEPRTNLQFDLAPQLAMAGCGRGTRWRFLPPTS